MMTKINEFNIKCDFALKNSWHEKLRKGFRFTLKDSGNFSNTTGYYVHLRWSMVKHTPRSEKWLLKIHNPFIL